MGPDCEDNISSMQTKISFYLIKLIIIIFEIEAVNNAYVVDVALLKRFKTYLDGAIISILSKNRLNSFASGKAGFNTPSATFTDSDSSKLETND